MERLSMKIPIIIMPILFNVWGLLSLQVQCGRKEREIAYNLKVGVIDRSNII